MYLKDPWLWPEVWIINPQIPNPHLIYPGDTLALAYGADGRPHVSVEQAGAVRLDPRLRSTPLDSAIPTIPYSAIAAFLSRPTVMTDDEVKHAPYVLAFRDMHDVAGSNNEVYIRNLTAIREFPLRRRARRQLRCAIRMTTRLLGYEGIYTATALVQRPGDPAKALLIDPARETLRGDRLLSAENTETPVTFTPRAPVEPGARAHHRRGRWHGTRRSVRGDRHQPRQAARASSPATCSRSTRPATSSATCIAAARNIGVEHRHLLRPEGEAAG